MSDTVTEPELVAYDRLPTWFTAAVTDAVQELMGAVMRGEDRTAFDRYRARVRELQTMLNEARQ